MVSSQFWIPLTLEAHPAHQERKTHDVARKWVYRLRESVPSGLCPFLPHWQLGPGLWSRDKAVIGEREACGEGAGFSLQMRESLPSLGVWKHHRLSVIPHAAQVTAYYGTLPPLSTFWEVPAGSPTVLRCWSLPRLWFALPALGPFKLGHPVEGHS